MSYQLIYTSALQLLDSHAAGYGIVARSEKLPKALCARLSALSVYRDPRGGSVTTGPQFSYHILDHAGISWHVLSCVQQAGADYSGRGCYIAHHLILDPEEVRELLQNKLRPTPAGVTLALLKCGFWLSRWQGEPRFITQEPDPTPEYLPDASTQPTWKRLTGHKANARAFFTSPFERDCLITIAPGTPSTDILLLFHESDWLTHTRGWGVSYTTVADEADSYAETLRMVTAPGSPLIQRAVRTGHPVLEIADDMEIPQVEAPMPPPGSLPVQAQSHQPPQVNIVRALSRSVSHYHYTEEPDWLLYDVKPARPRFIPGTVITLGAAACLTLAGWHYLAGNCDSPKQEPAPVLTHSSTDNIQQLAALLRAEYDHDSADQLLRTLAALPVANPEDALLLEAASLILNARQKGARHAVSASRLCECARLLGLQDSDMVRLYLYEATHGTTPEEWKQQFDGQQIADWLKLKQKEPQVMGLMQSERLKPYMIADSGQTPPPTILATADSGTPEEETEADAVPVSGRVSLIPSAAVSGNALPSELENIIPALPLSIHTGSYVVSAFAKGGELQAPQRLELSPDGYHLYITPTENAGEFLLKPEHRNGQPAAVPEVRFTVRAGRLQHIRCEGSEAVVSFPVPTQEDFHTNVVLASSFGIPVPGGKVKALPPAAMADLTISPDDLEIVAATNERPAPRITLRPKQNFPWTLSRSDINKVHFSVKLPVLAGHNGLQFTGEKTGTFEWQGEKVTKETDSITTVRCELERRPDLPGRLNRAFERVMNTPCCGEVALKDKSMTLGHLYYICCALANENLSRSEKRQLHKSYFRLFANKQFNKVLMRILAQDSILHITPEQASANKFKAIQTRNNITRLLDNRNTRDLIRQRVCEVLTRTMYAAYTEEQKTWEEQQKHSPVLMLRGISFGSHVELLWQFNLQEEER